MEQIQADSGSIDWDETYHCVVLTLQGELPLAQMQTLSNQSLQLLEKKKGERLLIDNTRLAPFGMEVVRWGTQVWLPRARDCGLRFVAVLKPHDRLTYVMLAGFRRHPAVIPFKVVLFEEMTRAKAWLASCP